MQGLVEIKNAMEAIMPTPADEAPKAGWERAVDAVLGSPIIEGIAQRVAEGGAVTPEEPAMVNIRKPDGSVVAVPAAYVAQMQAQKAARESQGDDAQPKTQAEPEINVDPKDVEKAVMFIEAALRNGTPPEIFAASARNMMPAEILSYIKTRGVDHFLNNVAKLEDSSPLATVVGRQYVRQVAKFLLEGTTDLADDEPDSPMES
jgi:hypothetical protein